MVCCACCIAFPPTVPVRAVFTGMPGSVWHDGRPSVVPAKTFGALGPRKNITSRTFGVPFTAFQPLPSQPLHAAHTAEASRVAPALSFGLEWDACHTGVVRRKRASQQATLDVRWDALSHAWQVTTISTDMVQWVQNGK